MDVKKLTARSPDEWFADIPDMLKWIQFLSDSGHYCSGASVDIIGRYITIATPAYNPPNFAGTIINNNFK